MLSLQANANKLKEFALTMNQIQQRMLLFWKLLKSQRRNSLFFLTIS